MLFACFFFVCYVFHLDTYITFFFILDNYPQQKQKTKSMDKIFQIADEGDYTYKWDRDIPTAFITTTRMPRKSINKNDINEFILWLYEYLNSIIPISYIYVLFLFASVCWIIHILCCSSKDIDPMDTNGNSKKYKLYSTKIYPKKAILLHV